MLKIDTHFRGFRDPRTPRSGLCGGFGRSLSCSKLWRRLPLWQWETTIARADTTLGRTRMRMESGCWSLWRVRCRSNIGGTGAATERVMWTRRDSTPAAQRSIRDASSRRTPQSTRFRPICPPRRWNACSFNLFCLFSFYALCFWLHCLVSCGALIAPSFSTPGIFNAHVFKIGRVNPRLWGISCRFANRKKAVFRGAWAQ